MNSLIFSILSCLIFLMSLSPQTVHGRTMFSINHHHNKDPSTNCTNQMNDLQIQLDSCFTGTVDNGNLTVVNLTNQLGQEDDPADIKKARQQLLETMCCVIEQAKVCANIVKVLYLLLVEVGNRGVNGVENSYLPSTV